MGTEAVLIARQERHVARGHLLPLDGVRGLAILMVMSCHAFESNYEARGFVIRTVGGLLHYGNTGVDLFFVLSGFLITGILYDSLQDEGYFRKFYARRVLRIFPLYYGVLFVCLLLTWPLHLHWRGMGWLAVFYLQNLRPSGVESFSLGSHISLYHLTTLAMEEQFYLVWPTIVLFVGAKRGLLRTALIGSVGAMVLRLALVALGASSLAIHVTTICRADSFLLGGALALLYRSPSWAGVMRWAPWGFVAAMAIYASGNAIVNTRFIDAPWQGMMWSEGMSYTLLAIGYASLIGWSLKEESVCSWIFRRRWMRFLGKYSYGLYVLHVLVLSAIALPLRAALLRNTHSKAAAVVGAGLICSAISIVAAYASYNLYEKHFLKLKHHFDYSRKTLNHGSPEDAFTQ